jgi:hypothetical protein
VIAMTRQLTRDTAAPDRSWPTGREVAAGLRVEARLTAALMAGALGYATLRYNVFKGVPWADWPAYTVNKALAVASLLMLAASALRLRRPDARIGILMATAGALALAHSLLSFALFDPGYYPRLFAAGKLTATAGLSLTLGAGVMAAMELGARRADRWTPAVRHRALAAVAFASGTHAALPALASWAEPSTWPGGMPPLTLISFLAGVIAVAGWRLRVR